MKKTILPKLFVGYLLFAIMGFAVISTLTYHLSHRFIIKNEAAKLYKEATLIASDYAVSYYNNTITLAEFQERLNALEHYLAAQIWIIGTTGDILVDSAQNAHTEPPEAITDFNISDFGSRYYQTGNFYGRFEEERLSVYAPISINYRVKGYVFIHKPSVVMASFNNGFLYIAYFTLAILILCAFVLLAIFTFTIILPVKKLIRAAGEYALGNFDYPIHVQSNDEIGYLAASFSYMANELNTLEEDQRKFVSNVSHDFRSPLTSIKGYLEAMLDGTIPPELHEKYLTIVLNETERLTKLTNSLLTLNNLNTKGMLLEKTDFDINQVIRNVAASFEGTCREKKIAIELILTGEEMYVTADMGKIQQVLYNLLDNAIKFSRHNSIIKLETTEKHNKIFVSVKDSGIGIPKDNLKLIWDRFYKSDISRGKDKKGTGLGLSITKEIIQSHGEHINVISTEGVGTEFIFSLPEADIEDDY